MRNLLVPAAMVAVCAISVTGARGAQSSPDGPQSKGEVLFEHRCARCHGIGADGDEGLAPALTGVVGRAVASRTDYLYTRQLKAKSGVWNAELLDRYLADPQAFAPGADMDVISPDPDERAAIIAYLKTLK